MITRLSEVLCRRLIQVLFGVLVLVISSSSAMAAWATDSFQINSDSLIVSATTEADWWEMFDTGGIAVTAEISREGYLINEGSQSAVGTGYGYVEVDVVAFITSGSATYYMSSEHYSNSAEYDDYWTMFAQGSESYQYVDPSDQPELTDFQQNGQPELDDLVQFGAIYGWSSDTYGNSMALSFSDPMAGYPAIAACASDPACVVVGTVVTGWVIYTNWGNIKAFLDNLHITWSQPGIKKPNSGIPTGTRDIDQMGWGRDRIHDIKTGIGAGPKDWVGIDPNGDVWTGTPSGAPEDHGPWGPYTNH